MSLETSNDRSASRATVVVVPRDRFSRARESLESIFEHTAAPFELVYVDAGSPAPLRDWLRDQARLHGFELIRHGGYLPPNESRAIGAARATTDFVVFIDNDVNVTPGWLAKLVECADETGAAMVSPLTCEDGFDRIHFAGGEVAINVDQEGGGETRRVRDEMFFAQRSLASVGSKIHREQCTLAEYHCVLVRRSDLERVGGPDPTILSTRDHVDLSLAITQAGGTVWLEPESVVTFMGTTPLEPRDLHFYALRWSDEWQRRSLERFREKWDLANDEFFQQRLGNLDWRRRNAIVGPIARRLTLGRKSPRVETMLVPVEHRLNRWITRRYDRAREREEAGAGAPAP